MDFTFKSEIDSLYFNKICGFQDVHCEKISRHFQPLVNRTRNLSNLVLLILKESLSIDACKPRKLITDSPKRDKVVHAGLVNVILAAGPGGSAFNHALIDKLSSTLKKSEGLTVKQTAFIGNGEHDISLCSILDAVQKAKEEKRPIVLFLQSHGRAIREGHELLLGCKQWSSSRELFRRLKNELGDTYPLSIFMTACDGGAATQAALEELPEGSIFVALTRHSEEVSGFDVDRFANSVDHAPWSSAENLLYHYLTKSLKNRYTPIIAYVPERSMDLGRLLVSRIGMPFTAMQQARIHLKIDDFLSKEYVDSLIHKIETSRSEYDIFAVDYGPALAVVLASLTK